MTSLEKRSKVKEVLYIMCAHDVLCFNQFVTEMKEFLLKEKE